MECPRCAGCMIRQSFEDFEDDTGSIIFYGWRCLICGEIIDSTILTNRQTKPAPTTSKTRKRLAFR